MSSYLKGRGPGVPPDSPRQASEGRGRTLSAFPLFRAVWLDLGIVLAAVLFGCAVRAHAGFSIPSYSPSNPVGLVKSDPALLYWFTEQIAANHGVIPPDFAASKMVQWPDPVDLPGEFPMAQPWLAANAWRIWNGLGAAVPLHTFCIAFFALFASLAAAGVYGLARELSGRRDLAALALLLWLLLPANYRTVSFVLLGEDVSFPLLALHLWLLARAVRLRTPASYLLAGLALLGTMASWHAAGFFVAMEAVAFFVWYLRSGQNPFSARRSWLALLPLLLGCVLEPMLRSKLQFLSVPMQLALSLLLLAWIERRRTLPAAARIVAAAGAAGLLFGAGLLASRAMHAGLGDYSHVFRLIAAKLRFLGQKPADPNLLPFEVRILWQGPFDTMPLSEFFRLPNLGLLALLAVLVPGARAWRRGRSEDHGQGHGEDRSQDHRQDRGTSAVGVFAPFACFSLLATWLIERTVILTGFLAPVALALALRKVKNPLYILAGFLVPIAFAACSFPRYLELVPANPWHNDAARLRLLVNLVEEKVPPGAPVACDEYISPVLLAHTGRPILVQPKYEWVAARQRLEDFLMAATRGTPGDLAAFLDAHDCRYLLIDTRVLWPTNYQVGLPDPHMPYVPGSALAEMISTRDVPGFRLLSQLRNPKIEGVRGPDLFIGLYERTGD